MESVNLILNYEFDQHIFIEFNSKYNKQECETIKDILYYILGLCYNKDHILELDCFKVYINKNDNIPNKHMLNFIINKLSELQNITLYLDEVLDPDNTNFAIVRLDEYYRYKYTNFVDYTILCKTYYLQNCLYNLNNFWNKTFKIGNIIIKYYTKESALTIIDQFKALKILQKSKIKNDLDLLEFKKILTN